jgi:hypothetical protein
MLTDFSVTIPDDQWEDVTSTVASDAPARSILLSTVTVNGCSLHVEAIEVLKGEPVQQAAHEDLEEQFERVWAAAEGYGGPLQEAQIGGRRYVLLATPFSD